MDKGRKAEFEKAGIAVDDGEEGSACIAGPEGADQAGAIPPAGEIADPEGGEEEESADVPVIRYELADPNMKAWLNRILDAGATPPMPGQGVERTIIVTGPPRTGTSMIAGLLHFSGVHMGSNLHGIVPHNERGLFEDEKVIRLNNTILAMASGSWLNPPPGKNFRFVTDTSQIAYLVAYEQEPDWGMKDGRFCLTFPLWEEILSDCRPAVIVCHRNLFSVARSMARHWAIPIDHALYVAAEYERRLSRFLGIRRDWPVFHLPFEQFMENPRAWTRSLSRFLGIEIPDHVVDQFVEPNLVHF